MSDPSLASSPSVEDIRLVEGRSFLWVAVFGCFGALAFVASTVAGVRGDIGSTGYLIAVSVSVGLIAAAVGLGHCLDPENMARRRASIAPSPESIPTS